MSDVNYKSLDMALKDLAYALNQMIECIDHPGENKKRYQLSLNFTINREAIDLANIHLNEANGGIKVKNFKYELGLPAWAFEEEEDV